MSFVGTGPKQTPTNKIIYLISYYRNVKKEIRLTSLNEDLSELIKIAIKNDPKLKKLIKESGNKFDNYFTNEIFRHSLTVDIPKNKSC